MISSKIRTELDKPQLDGIVRDLEDKDGHHDGVLGLLKTEVERNRCKHKQRTTNTFAK